MKKYLCEFIGTAVLVLFGCGAATLGGNLGVVGIALAFGLSIIAMAYVIGNISGCHVNPAVSLAMLIDKRIDFKDFCGYVIAQVLGAFAGAVLLYVIISNNSLLDISYTGLGANGFGMLSDNEITMAGAFLVEFVLTLVFVFTVLGVTADESKSSVAGIVIGLTLTFVHILGIPLTGTSVNPARSLAPAVLVGGEALSQVWLFIVAPLLGSVIAALLFRILKSKKEI